MRYYKNHLDRLYRHYDNWDVFVFNPIGQIWDKYKFPIIATEHMETSLTRITEQELEELLFVELI